MLDLWRKVELREATPDERVDAVCEAGASKDARFLPKVKALFKDEDEQVRYYALQAAVIDLKDKSPEIVKTCWDFIRSDPDDDVRLMATTCLGHIFFNSRDPQLFRRVRSLLDSRDLSAFVKGGLYSMLFKVAGRPPREWPGLFEPRKVFEETDIDWAKLAWLEDQLGEQTEDRDA